MQSAAIVSFDSQLNYDSTYYDVAVSLMRILISIYLPAFRQWKFQKQTNSKIIHRFIQIFYESVDRTEGNVCRPVAFYSRQNSVVGVGRKLLIQSQCGKCIQIHTTEIPLHSLIGFIAYVHHQLFCFEIECKASSLLRPVSNPVFLLR